MDIELSPRPLASGLSIESDFYGDNHIILLESINYI